MPLFNIDNDKLEPVKYVKFNYEKDIQKLTENNLETVFNLKFVSSEFQIDDLRIDTLAYNEETNSFVIIEYKNTKSYSVVDQGYTYLSLLLNNRADFILEFNNKFNTNKGLNDIDFSQSKIIFISPSYTKYQTHAIRFNDLAFELWKVAKFSNNTVLYDKIEIKSNASIHSKYNSPYENDEIIVYTEEYHLKNKSEIVRELYDSLKESIQDTYCDVEFVPVKLYISLKVNNHNLISIQPQSNGLKIWLNIKKGLLNDYLNKTHDVSNLGHHGTGDYEIKINNKEDVFYLLELLKQVYEYKS